MAAPRPGHTTDRVSASLARFVHAARIVNATSVAGVYTTDPRKDPKARLLERVTFRDLIDLAGKGHAAAGPSVVFDPVEVDEVPQNRAPLGWVYGRDPAPAAPAIFRPPVPRTLRV